MKKLLLSVLTVLMFFCGTTVIADTEVVIDFSDELNKNITGILPGTVDSQTEDTHFKSTKDHGIAYCSEGTLKNPEDEQNAVWNNCQVLNSIASKSLAYIYENGYGNDDNGYTSNNYLVGGDKYTDYFITQAAVWYFMSPPDWFSNFDVNTHTYNGLTNTNSVKISNLIKDAQEAQKGPSLTITANDNDMSLSLVGNYYVSEAIRVSGRYLNSNITIRISGQNGAFVTTDINSIKGVSSIENNSTIYVKIPVNNVVDKEEIEFSLSAKATSAIGTGKILECQYGGSQYNTDDIQNIIIYNPSNEDVSTTVEYNIDTVTVNILKKDTNNEMLKGATLTLKQGNNVIKSWVTDTNLKTIKLLPGTYTLIETETPDGYIVNNDIITFEVKVDGKVYINNKVVDEVVVVNKPIIINISKRKINEDSELSDAILKITDKDGNIVKDIEGNSLEWTTSDEPKSFHVAVGTYILEEVKAPSGYELSDKKIEFTVNEDGTVTVEEGILITNKIVLENNLIVFENIPEPDDLPTGSMILYIAIGVGLIAIGVTIFIILKKYKK